jgi:hypothetical protein
MLHAAVRWTLLATMIFTVPLAYLMIVVGGLLTYAHIVVLSTASSLSLELNVVYLIGYGASLYFIAGLLANRIIRQKRHALLSVWSGTVLLLVAVGLLPIYGVSHARSVYDHGISAYELLVSGTLR